MQGLLGTKVGITRIFDQEGRQVAATAIKCGPCIVLRRLRAEKDGCDAVQIGFGETLEKRLTKAETGVFRKLNKTPMRHRAQFDIDAGEDYKEGDTISAEVFRNVSYVDVSGVTKGKGFQGVMRRHGMGGGVASHGGQSKRRSGSIGALGPRRIYKGKRMPGHMGCVRSTQQNLRVIEVLGEDNVLLVGGPVPGHAGSLVTIRRSVKKGGKR